MIAGKVRIGGTGLYYETAGEGHPQAEKVVGSGAAHLPNLEQTGELDRLALDFSEKRERRRTR